MQSALIHAVDIRVLPNDDEAERFLRKVMDRQNCFAASYRRLQSVETDLPIIQAYSRKEESHTNKTVDFCLKLVNLGVPIYIFEWDVNPLAESG